MEAKIKNFILKSGVILKDQMAHDKVIVALAIVLLLSTNVEIVEAQVNADQFKDACGKMVNLMKGPFGAMGIKDSQKISISKTICEGILPQHWIRIPIVKGNIFISSY